MRLEKINSLILSLCFVLPLWITSSSAAQMRTLTSRYYEIHTDLDTKLAEDLARRMDVMHAEYSARLSAFGKGEEKFTVYIFAKKKDYENLTDNRFPNSGGVYLRNRKLLAAFLEGQGRDGLRRTLQHEAFHQFAERVIGNNIPIWLNEGMAQVFEEGIWTGQQFKIEQASPRKMRQLKQDMAAQRMVPFQRFLSLTEKEWAGNMPQAQTAAAQYTQAWAMTHFLVFAKDQAGQYQYRNRLISMLKMLNNGTRPNDAFVRSFSDNFEGFEDRFLEYARALQPSQEAIYVEYQTILADMLVMAASQGQRFSDGESFRAFLSDGGMRLRYSKGDVQWSTNTDPSAYLRDSAGRAMTAEQFFFSPHGGAPLPDMICRPIPGLQFRTIFHDAPDKIDHETIVETR